MKRYNFSQDFKREVCEYYSNHTANETMEHFKINVHNTLLSQWYKSFGFLPKSSARNPDPKRAMKRKQPKKGILIKKGGYILDGKFYGEAEFAKVQKKLTVGATFTKVTVTKHKVGIIQS